MEKLKKILLVEDDAKDIELTLAALDNSNLHNKVEVVRDGVEALDYLYRRNQFRDRNPENPAVMLLDLKMPRLGGLEVLEKIRSDEQFEKLPVVVLTSSREEQDLVESYKLGINAYVVKPVDFSQFIEAVRVIGLFWGIFNEPPKKSLR